MSLWLLGFPGWVKYVCHLLFKTIRKAKPQKDKELYICILLWKIIKQNVDYCTICWNQSYLDKIKTPNIHFRSYVYYIILEYFFFNWIVKFNSKEKNLVTRVVYFSYNENRTFEKLLSQNASKLYLVLNQCCIPSPISLSPPLCTRV